MPKEVQLFVAQPDADCTNGNKNVGIKAMLLIPSKQGKLNQAIKFLSKIALINIYKQCSSLPIDRMPRRG